MRAGSELVCTVATAAPQRGQCRLPLNIMAKHLGQAIVASRDSQNWHREASLEIAAPQLGQLSVSACIAAHSISRRLTGLDTLGYAMLARTIKSVGEDQCMRLRLAFGFAVLFAIANVFGVSANTKVQEDNQPKRKLNVPFNRHRTGIDKPKHRGIRRHYRKAGKSAARGSKRFARNIAHGRPIKGGKEFGKGMGGFGKHTGKGTAKVGSKTGRKVKHAVTP